VSRRSCARDIVDNADADWMIWCREALPVKG